MILVTGATGSIGTHLIRYLKQADADFVAFVRDEPKGQGLGCDLAVGDFDDPSSVAAALEGVDKLFLNAAGAVPTSGEQPMIAQQKMLIDAAQRAGVLYVVKVSVWGAAPSGPLAQGAHWEIERYLKASGMQWTILQMSSFMQNFITGAGIFSDDGTLTGSYADSRVSYIDCDDIAACGAALLTQPARSGETLVLTGPESLTQVEIADKLSLAVGKPVRYVDQPPGEMVASLTTQGLPAQFAADIVELWIQVARGSMAATTSAVEELIGRKPRSFDAFLTANQHAFK